MSNRGCIRGMNHFPQTLRIRVRSKMFAAGYVWCILFRTDNVNNYAMIIWFHLVREARSASERLSPTGPT